jgi:hypothetical protein
MIERLAYRSVPRYMSSEIQRKETPKERQAEPEQTETRIHSLAFELVKSVQEITGRVADNSALQRDAANKKPAEANNAAAATGTNSSIEFSTQQLYLTAMKVGHAGHILSDSHDRYDHSDHKVDPHNPNEVVENKKLEWNGKEIQLRTRDGVPDYFKDAEGKEWVSNDGEGWTKKDGPITETFRSKITFDENKQELKLENPFGNSTVFKTDGSMSTSFKTRDGQEVSMSKTADGKQFINDGKRNWTSADGKNWTSGADQKQGNYEIDENSRLLLTDASGKEKVEKQSEQAQSLNEKMDELENRFHIKLGRPGDKPVYSEDKRKVAFDVRLPTQEELKVTEEVLSKFAHVAKKNGKDFEGLQINFAASKGVGLTFDEHGWHDEAKDGKPSTIGIAPRDFAQTRGYDGMEGTLLHEMTHQLQELEWIDKEHNEKVPPDIEKFFGFQHVKPPATKEEEGTYRLTDSQGRKWQWENKDGKVDDDAMWYPVENGKIVHDDDRALSEKEMRKELPPEKRPATDYFFNPAETHAEAISMYLFDRRMLHGINKPLYEAVKKWDQRDINYRYGFDKRADGQIVAKMIRGADGNVVPNTSENRRAVKELEDSWPKNAKAPVMPFAINGHRCPRC